MVINAMSGDVVIKRVQIKKRCRTRMGPRRTPPFKSDSGGRGTWKEMGQEVGRKSGENGMEEVREAKRK